VVFNEAKMNERVKTSSRYQSLCRCEENEHREM